MIKILFANLLEKGLNKFLGLSPHYHDFLKKHADKVIQFELEEIKQDIFLVFNPENIYVYATYSNAPSTRIRGNFFSFAKQLSNATSNELYVEGDMELAQDFQQWLKGMDINWQEYSAFFVGDFATQQIEKFLQQLSSAGLKNKTRTIEDIRDYIQEEKRFVPTRAEIEDFYDDVALLKNSIDRLEARWTRLRKK